ncbi:ATP-binding protein [Pelagibius sp. 7325]|uniref:sensor histidine kinase n=1 Tax=Pelagibius sp. 7325 TaxID=3131994 RepID=UPI0030EEE0DB
MQNLQQIAQLRRTMRRLAILVALATAVSLPLGYATVSFSNQSGFLQHQASLAAERLAGYIYVQGASWRYTRERLAEIIGETQSSVSAIHETVTGPDGVPVVSYAPLPEWPRLSESADIVVAGVPVATVTATATAKPLVLNTVGVGLFALLLAGGALVAMHLLPLRALDETLGELQGSLATIKAHAAETSFAYEELKRQHRLVEETTQELMRTRDQAMAADRTKSAFLATMSHELRTPLNAIIGFSDMLAQEIFGPLGNPRYRDYCNSIGDSGRHLLAVINDVLDISKVEAGKLQLHLEDVDLWQLLDSCSRLVRAKVFEAGVDLHLEQPVAPLPLLRADAVKVKQIALNLMSNALKFTPAGGSIGITLGSAPGKGVFFSITDTGIGMSDAEIALALQPFQQVDNSHTRKYEGTGLGLPLAKALAEQHGGRLEVASSPGAGTVVTVILPQTPADRSLPASAPPSAPPRLRKA